LLTDGARPVEGCIFGAEEGDGRRKNGNSLVERDDGGVMLRENVFCCENWKFVL